MRWWKARWSTFYFEFIALIVKYFQSGFHFPLRYFVYIGITAIVRLIIVDHKSRSMC